MVESLDEGTLLGPIMISTMLVMMMQHSTIRKFLVRILFIRFIGGRAAGDDGDTFDRFCTSATPLLLFVALRNYYSCFTLMVRKKSRFSSSFSR